MTFSHVLYLYLYELVRNGYLYTHVPYWYQHFIFSGSIIDKNYGLMLANNRGLSISVKLSKYFSFFNQLMPFSSRGVH